MNKELIPVTQFFNRTFEVIKRCIFTPNGRTTVTRIICENGLEIVQAIRVPEYAKKANYRELLITLVRDFGFTKQQAADTCGISYPYVTKLLRQK